MILVTGTSGRFSSAVLVELRARGTPAVGGSRTPSPGQRNVDFSAPDSLDLSGVDILPLVSAGIREDDRQIALNHVAVGVVERDGASRIVYTSLTGVGDHLPMVLPHRVTERMIMANGMIWIVLCNGVYAEIFGVPFSCEKCGEALRIVSPLGDGAVAAMARHDLACVVASALSDSDRHGRKAYELVGGCAVSIADAAVRLGCEVRDISPGGYRQLFAEGGMSSFRQSLMLLTASVIRHGLLARTGDDLPYPPGWEPTDPLAVAAKALAVRRAVVPQVALSRVKGTASWVTPRSRGKTMAREGECTVGCSGRAWTRGAGRMELVLAGALELQLTCSDRGAPRRRPGRHWLMGCRRRC